MSPADDSSEESAFLTRPETWNGPWFESPFFAHQCAQPGADPERVAQAAEFEKRGLLRLEFEIERELTERIVERFDWLFDPATEFDAPEPFRDHLHRFIDRRQDAWAVLPAVRELAVHERVLDVLRGLYGREPIPFQTLNFRAGSAQSMHSDGFHFASLPKGFLCGVWVALEDVTEDNGPLMYAPGSHKLPWVELADLRRRAAHDGTQLGENYRLYEEYVRAALAANDWPTERLVAKRGTALIWHGNLLHGGSPILDPGSTRASQVTHYYFEDCAHYTPVHSDTALGEFELRSVHDIRTGERVPPRFNGRELRGVDLGYPDCDLSKLVSAATAPADRAEPLEKLRRQASELEDDRCRLDERNRNLTRDIDGFEAEREQLLASLAGFEAERASHLSHAADLEQQLARIRATPSYRFFGRLKHLLGRGRA